MAPTLRQIAARADVSVSTASRALNGHPALPSRTIDRVRNAAEQLAYRPRRSHRRLDARRCLARANIGLFSLGMDRSLVGLPVIASAIAGAEGALSAAGAVVQLAQVPDLAAPPQGLFRKRLDGLLLVGALQGDLLARAPAELVEQLGRLNAVWILGRPRGCSGDAVASNDFQTGVLAAEYLIARGHRRLAYLNPKPDHLLFRRREDGFVTAARRQGIEPLIFAEAPQGRWPFPLQAPYDVAVVQSLVDRLLAARPRITAVFAAADSVAVLAYRALAVVRKEVGRDISVISGNNDAALIAGLHPQLTTFDVHAEELGRLAVRQLAMRIAYPEPLPSSELFIEPTLAEGQSVASVRR